MAFKADSLTKGEIISIIFIYGWGWYFKDALVTEKASLDFDKVSKPSEMRVSINKVLRNEEGIFGAIGVINETDAHFWDNMWIGFYCGAESDWDFCENLCPFTHAEFYKIDPVWYPSLPPDDVPYITGAIIPAKTMDDITKWKSKPKPTGMFPS